MPGANGAGKVMTTVCGSGAATVSFLPPACIESAITLPLFSSYAASNENSTSSAVNGWPSEKATPCRSVERDAAAARPRPSSVRPVRFDRLGRLVDADQPGLGQGGDQVGGGVLRGVAVEAARLGADGDEQLAAARDVTIADGRRRRSDAVFERHAADAAIAEGGDRERERQSA